MKIIRMGIMLGAALLLLPNPPEDNPADVGAPVTAQQAQVDPFSIIQAAASAAHDVGSICQREPQACTTAAHVFRQVESKARYGVRLLYEWAQEDDAGHATPSQPVGRLSVIADPMPTGSTGSADQTDAAPSQSTLRIEDLIPEWRGPVRQPARNS